MNIHLFLLLILGSITDSFFFTIFYHKQHHIKKYWCLILESSLIIIIYNWLFMGFPYRAIFILFSVGTSIYFSTRDKKSLLYFIFFALINIFAIDNPLYFLCGSTITGFISANIIKIFIINTLKNESEHQIKFKFIKITLKMIIVVAIFLLLIGATMTIKARWF